MPPIGRPLVDFTRHSLWPLGTINLPLTLVSHDGRKRITRAIKFSVIRYPIKQNILLGLPTLFKLKAIPSTIHGTVKFSIHTGSTTIIANTPCQQVCHQFIATPKLVRVPKKSKEDQPTEKHTIHSGHPEQEIRIGRIFRRKLMSC